MMNVYTVELPRDDPWRNGHLAALASLPMRFSDRPVQAASVRVIAGTSEHWIVQARKAIDHGARAVVVVQPRPVPLAQVRELNAHAQASDVVMAAANPYLTQLLDSPFWPEVRRSAEEAALLISTLAVTNGGGPDALRCSLLAHLGIVRNIMPHVKLSHSVRPTSAHHVLTGDAERAAVILTGFNASCGHGLALDLVGRATRWHVWCSAPGLAQPAKIERFDAAGRLGNRPRYESGLRTVWRAVHEAMDGDADPNLGLGRLELDLALLERVRDVAAPMPR
jgi:hypothetical protein